MARVAEGLGVAWDTANDAVLADGQRLLIEDPTRLDALADGVPRALVELRKLDRILTRRAEDVLAYFDHPRTRATDLPKP